MRTVKLYNLISSSSNGNSIIYRDEVLVDVGVKFSDLAPLLDKVKYILLTHRHSDHIRKSTVKRIVKERPDIEWYLGEHLLHILEEFSIPNMNIVEVNKVYNLGKDIKISPIKLYHDVENFGYRIVFRDKKKIIHATDTAHLDGIVAKDYDLYALEYNHDELRIEKEIEEKLEKGEFCYEIGARNSHLSFQKCMKFFEENRKVDSELLKLHISHKYKGENV